MPLTKKELASAADALFKDLGANKPPYIILSHFSHTYPVVIQHAPENCPQARASRLTGITAVRSYFDLLATHWDRSEPKRHSLVAHEDTQQVIVNASVTWTWKASGKHWREDFTCTLDYDDSGKVISYIMTTNSAATTCVMRAVDPEVAVAEPSRFTFADKPGDPPGSGLFTSF